MIERRTGTPPGVVLVLPPWLAEAAPHGLVIPDPEGRVRFVVELARQSASEGGGPFGAAVFEENGSLIAAGANLVLPGGSSILHAEVVALLAAQAVLGRHTLQQDGARREIACSCDPCAMCLGAIHWAGLASLVTAASTEDARREGFDEGPVDDASYDYLARRGMDVRRGVLREEAATVLHEYRRLGRPDYGA